MYRSRRSKHTVIIGVIAAVLLIALFGATLYFFEHSWGDEDKGTVGTDDGSVLQTLHIGDKDYQITHNLETYLMMGTDDSGNIDAEGTAEYRGQLADFLLLLVIDRTDDKYGMIQIDRNTITAVQTLEGDENHADRMNFQICVAHWYGKNPEEGCSNTVWSVSNLLGGLDIDGYYSIHMSQVGTLNHAVGGVEVTIEDDMTMVDPAMQKGATLVLSDEQAEKFVHARMEVGDGTNASRMKRQSEYMKGFQAKATQLMGSDPAFVNDLLEALKDGAVTDMPMNRLSVIINQAYKDDKLGTLQLDGETKLGDVLGDGEIHEEFYPTRESIAEVMCTLCGIDEDHIVAHEDIDSEENTGEDE